jgi:hypothetical protein
MGFADDAASAAQSRASPLSDPCRGGVDGLPGSHLSEVRIPNLILPMLRLHDFAAESF